MFARHANIQLLKCNLRSRGEVASAGVTPSNNVNILQYNTSEGWVLADHWMFLPFLCRALTAPLRPVRDARNAARNQTGILDDCTDALLGLRKLAEGHANARVSDGR